MKNGLSFPKPPVPVRVSWKPQHFCTTTWKQQFDHLTGHSHGSAWPMGQMPGSTTFCCYIPLVHQIVCSSICLFLNPFDRLSSTAGVGNQIDGGPVWVQIFWMASHWTNNKAAVLSCSPGDPLSFTELRGHSKNPHWLSMDQDHDPCSTGSKWIKQCLRLIILKHFPLSSHFHKKDWKFFLILMWYHFISSDFLALLHSFLSVWAVHLWMSSSLSAGFSLCPEAAPSLY